jgi:hypothetical protein
MRSSYSREGDYQSVDLEGLWTSFCVFATILILYFTLADPCDKPLRLWLVIKCLTLTLRLALKSSFPAYSQRYWFKLGIYLIKAFSIVWICVGFYWLETETICSIDPSWIYIWVLTYTVVFMLGFAAIALIFVVACYKLQKSNENDDEEVVQRVHLQ